MAGLTIADVVGFLKDVGMDIGADYIKDFTRFLGNEGTELIKKIITAKDRELQAEKRIYTGISNNITTLEMYGTKESLEKKKKKF